VKLSDFYFNLPENLIAQYPSAERGKSRLMVLDRQTKSRDHLMVEDLPRLLEPGSLLVFNNSRVRKSRLIGTSPSTGARVEFLLLEKIPDIAAGADAVDGVNPPGAADGTLWKVMAQRAKRRRVGSRYAFAVNPQGNADDRREAEITGEDGEFRILRFDAPIDDVWLDRHGHVPLPPYIKRADSSFDSERYQTVYASETGSAAAPTAGLHFTPEVLGALEQAGMETAFVTLHVGLGTFLPVRTENIEDHVMHRESYTISEEAARRIEQAKAAGRKIVAVGTTSVRTLESAWTVPETAGPEPAAGTLTRGEGSTRIFIYPGYRFQVVDQLFTNFHTPGSSLIMLVSAFAGAFAEADAGALGRDLILESYAEATEKSYRFFSYGDAMLIR
jgi:S-adenosylmethionine:tRNA ribosyltransferase-isomerase